MKYKTIKLRSGRLGKIRPGHPWVYKNQFLKVDPSIKPGEIISLVDTGDKFIGRGYYNPRSEISIRLLSFKDEPIDEAFFRNRIAEAAEKRKALRPITDAYRIIFSEADGLPGLIADIYRDTLVFQVLTFGMEKVKPLIVENLRAIIKPKFIYEKSRSPFRKLEGLKDVLMWWGEGGLTSVEILEGKAKFLVDIEHGHKTGFYLDQRRSRAALDNISKDKKVLDLFCYTGGFSVHAAMAGARKVRGVDIKEEWCELARRNAALNGVADKIGFIKGDAFPVLKAIRDSGEKFDIIVIDPPSFLKTRESLKSASKGYKELNEAAMKALSDDGILATFSCSYNMPNDIFAQVLKDAARGAGKNITILKRCHQAEDHPIVRAIPETGYLKGYFLRVKDEDAKVDA